MQWFRRHLTFANCVSLLALFVALGGVSYAALKLPKNSVGAKQIKAKAVKTGKIRANAVKSGKIANGAVANSDLASNAVSGLKIAEGGVGVGDLGANSVNGSKVGDGTLGLADLGPNSVDGSKVADGSLAPEDLGANSFLNGNITVQFLQHNADLANGAEVSIDVFCEPGQIGIGGGVRGDLTNSELTKVTASRPVNAPDNTGAPASDGTFLGWRGTFVNENNGMGIRPEVWVVCAGPTVP
jgi:hypothetical protein